MKDPKILYALIMVVCIFFTTYFPLIIIYFFKDQKVKGNITSKGEKIYYTMDHRLYNSVKEEKMFRNVQQAKKAGFRPPKK